MAQSTVSQARTSRPAHPAPTINAEAVQRAARSLFDVLRRCGSERQRLEETLRRAQERGGEPADDQQRRMASIDAWLRERLDKMQVADDLMRRREQRIERAEGGLNRLLTALQQQVGKAEQTRRSITETTKAVEAKVHAAGTGGPRSALGRPG
mgnify:FL=1